MNEVKPITVGTATAQPGEVARGVIPVTTTAGGGELGIPVIVMNGAKSGPCVWVDGAIHGDEPEGPLACYLLAQDVDIKELSGTLVLVPVMNVGAYEAAQRGNPVDTFSYDMNRIYPGRKEATSPSGLRTRTVSGWWVLPTLSCPFTRAATTRICLKPSSLPPTPPRRSWRGRWGRGGSLHSKPSARRETRWA